MPSEEPEKDAEKPVVGSPEEEVSNREEGNTEAEGVCRQAGHYSSTCSRAHAPFRKGAARKQVCKKCGQTGHNKATCTAEANTRDRNTEDNPGSVTEESNFFDDTFSFY